MAPDVTLYFSCLLLTFWGNGLSENGNATADEMKMVTKPLNLDDSLFFELVEPEEISYTYKVRPAKNFGAVMNQTLLGVELVPVKPIDACSDIQDYNFVAGSVAFIERGGCSFMTKTINVERVGALAAIIFDNKHDNDESMIDMIRDETDRSTDIPSFFLLGKDGHMIRRTLEANHLQYAVINIPVNTTGLNAAQMNHPPWTLW